MSKLPAPLKSFASATEVFLAHTGALQVRLLLLLLLIPNFFSRSSYINLLNPLTSFVALLWIFFQAVFIMLFIMVTPLGVVTMSVHSIPSVTWYMSYESP